MNTFPIRDGPHLLRKLRLEKLDTKVGSVLKTLSAACSRFDVNPVFYRYRFQRSLEYVAVVGGNIETGSERTRFESSVLVATQQYLAAR